MVQDSKVHITKQTFIKEGSCNIYDVYMYNKEQMMDI